MFKKDFLCDSVENTPTNEFGFWWKPMVLFRISDQNRVLLTLFFFSKMKKRNALAGELQITQTTLKYHEILINIIFCQFLIKALEYVKFKTSQKLDFGPFWASQGARQAPEIRAPLLRIPKIQKWQKLPIR